MPYAMNDAMRDETAQELAADLLQHGEGVPAEFAYHIEEAWQEVHAHEAHQGLLPLAPDYDTGFADMVVRVAQCQLDVIRERAVQSYNNGQAELIQEFRAAIAEAQAELHRKVAERYATS